MTDQTAEFDTPDEPDRPHIMGTDFLRSAEQIGWVKFDGDEFHGFMYSRPEEWRGGVREAVKKDGYIPVYVYGEQHPQDPADDLCQTCNGRGVVGGPGVSECPECGGCRHTSARTCEECE